MVIQNSVKLIATLGPSSLKSSIIKKLKKDIDLFRLNMSHLSISSLKKNLKFLKKNKITNVCIDTEGAQIRTAYVKKKFLDKGLNYNISTNKLRIKNLIKLYPKFNISDIKKNTKIKIGFEGLELSVLSNKINYLICKVTKGGTLESNKGVHIQQKISLNPLTEKDLDAIKIAKKFNIFHFALSFANCRKDVDYLRSLISKRSIVISKIESKTGFLNRREIIKSSNSVLIDRGDLSRYIDISKIPLAQRIIVKDAKKLRKKIYIATNLLETMVKSSDPTRAESNDIFSSLETGCSGLVLAAETAIGNYPAECVNFLKECLKIYNQRKRFTKDNNLFF
jgi:pyruvate kinase